MRRTTWILALLCALAAAAPAAGQPVVPARAPGTVECTTGPTFNLTATDGRIQTPDGNSLYMWGYAGAGGFQIPGPILCVTEGQTVTVNLTNNLAEPTSIVFPGQSGVTSSGGSPGLLAQEAAPSGGTVSYAFTASRPGTFMYESGSEPSKQVEMGLYGAIIVRPAMGANYAYNDESTEFDPEREYLILLHDIDPALHHAVDRGQPFDITTKHDRYWTVNGRAFPDAIADSFVPWLPNQPYGSLVWVEIGSELPALIRYANAGLSNHPFHPHGNHLSVIARDGALLQEGGANAATEAFAKTIGSGQTYDLLFRFDDDEGYSATSPVTFQGGEVTFPGLLNLTFKDDFTFYSGSPYLGDQDELPAAVTRLNECGEFYYPWHSHALNEFQNFDEGFGGLATLLRVDPIGGCPGNADAPVNVSPPVVSGALIEGQLLTGTNGTWAGTQPLSFSYQWQRLNGLIWSDIPGAAGPDYPVSGADVGEQLRICVTASNAFGAATACSAPTDPVVASLHLSFTNSGTIGGVAFTDDDIVAFDGANFSLVFDGSDVIGAAAAATVNLDAFAFIDEDSILISFDEALTGSNAIPGFGGLDDSDAARFDATSLGETTTGTLSRFFDGSDVGLTSTNENIDSIQWLDGPGLGSVIISTSGNPGLPGITNEADEDLFRLTPTSLGANTAGTWSYYFDGSDVGLGTTASEDVDSAWVDGNGDIYLSTVGNFTVAGLSGDDDDVFVFEPSSLGAATSGLFSATLQFDAAPHGQSANDVDGAGRRTAPVLTAVAKPARAGKPVTVSAGGKLRGRTLQIRARTTHCSPCVVKAKVKPRGQKLRTVKMRRVGKRYVATVRKLPRGPIAYYTVARDTDSRRVVRSGLRRARIGPAAVLPPINLCADEGTITLPGAGAVPIWGFGEVTAGVCGPVTLPGPQLAVTEGDVVTINLTNELATNVSLVFPGQNLAPDVVGVAPGGTASYVFTASGPGAYLYESGVDTQVQLPMGLYGTLMVRPALGPNYLYNDLATQFDQEHVMVLSEIDTDLNAAPGAFDPLEWSPDYWLIDGTAYPDTPNISAAPGDRLALRYLNAGQDHHTMELVGMRQRIMSRDSFAPPVRPQIVAETIATGATADAIAVVPNTPGATIPLYSRQLAVTNAGLFPGGMLRFVSVGP